MSTEIKDLLEEQKNTFDLMKKRQDKFDEDIKKNVPDTKAMDTGVEQLNEKIGELDLKLADLDKAEKQAKARKDLEVSIDSKASNREECRQFLGEMLKMVGINATSKGFNTLDLKCMEATKKIIESKNHSGLNDTTGGTFVMPFLDSRVDALVREFSAIRSFAGVQNISTDAYQRKIKKKNNGALRKSAMANFTAQTKQDTWGDLVIKVYDLFAIAIYEDNLLSDSAFNLVADLLQSISEDFAITEATEFVTNATGEGLRGILTYPNVAGNEFASIEQLTTASSLTFDYDDLIDLQALLNNVYSQRATWKMNRNSLAVARKVKDTTGQYIWSPSVQAGRPSTILGNPVLELFEAPDIAANSLSVIYGDDRAGYLIVDRLGMEVTRDELTQYPDTAYKVKRRSGGGLVKGEAYKILEIKA